MAVAGDSELVDVTITWAGGHQTTGQAVRPVARLDQLSYYPALLARVTGLAAAGRNNRQIAGVLNAEGFRPPKRTSRFTGEQVRTLISQRGIREPAQGPARRAHRPGTRPVVGPRPVRRAGHAHRQHLQLDLPRLDHRPPRPRNQELDHHRRRRSRCGSYASAGHARPASTPAPAGHHPRQKPAKRRKKDKEGSRERQIPLDR